MFTPAEKRNIAVYIAGVSVLIPLKDWVAVEGVLLGSIENAVS